MRKIKNVNDDVTIDTDASSQNIRLLILKDKFVKYRKCRMCGGVNGRSCEFCGETTDYEDEV